MQTRLRDAGIRTDLYLGEEKGLRKQLQYADRINARFALIVGSNEFEKGTVTIKDLKIGEAMSKDASQREEWLKKSREIQIEISQSDTVQEIRRLLGRR